MGGLWGRPRAELEEVTDVDIRNTLQIVQAAKKKKKKNAPINGLTFVELKKMMDMDAEDWYRPCLAYRLSTPPCRTPLLVWIYGH